MMVGKLILRQHLSTFHQVNSSCICLLFTWVSSFCSFFSISRVVYSFPFVPVLPMADAFNHALNQISTFLWQCAKHTGGDVSGISSKKCQRIL